MTDDDDPASALLPVWYRVPVRYRADVQYFVEGVADDAVLPASYAIRGDDDDAGRRDLPDASGDAIVALPGRYIRWRYSKLVIGSCRTGTTNRLFRDRDDWPVRPPGMCCSAAFYSIRPDLLVLWFWADHLDGISCLQPTIPTGDVLIPTYAIWWLDDIPYRYLPGMPPLLNRHLFHPVDTIYADMCDVE